MSWTLEAPLPDRSVVGVFDLRDLPKAGLLQDTRGRIVVPQRVCVDRTDRDVRKSALNHLCHRIRCQTLSAERGSDGVSDFDDTVG